MNSRRIMFEMLISALLIALIVPGCTDSLTDANDPRYVAEASILFEIDTSGYSTFHLEGINGSISVTGVPGSQVVRIEGERRVASDTQSDADAHLPLLQVEVDETAPLLLVRTDQPDNSEGRSYEVDYRITVPADMRVELAAVNGPVTVVGMENDLSVSNVNGPVTLDKILANVSASLVNGAITSTVTCPPGGSIAMSTVNGGIDLAIPKQTSAAFDADVTNGTISTTNLVLTNVQSSPKHLSGRLGAGDGSISLSVVNGSIVVAGF